MAREYKVLCALSVTPVRAPLPIALCLDPGVAGAPFLVMDYINGVAITDRLPGAYGSDPVTLQRVGVEMMAGLATLHSVDWRAVGLGDFGKPEGFLERQVSRWSSQLASYQVRELPRFRQLGDWLEEHRPSTTQPALIHGDFHLDNCLFSPAEPRLAAIIDWELATIGDPLLDVGLALGFWGTRLTDPVAMPWIQAISRLPGAPSREMLAAEYTRRSGQSLERLPYYMALAFWKLAAIVEGAYTQFLVGDLHSDYARRLAEDVPLLLEEAAAFASLE
jgi:aminoglycoside phosphotransferase (APT) family kinase protein